MDWRAIMVSVVVAVGLIGCHEESDTHPMVPPLGAGTCSTSTCTPTSTSGSWTFDDEESEWQWVADDEADEGGESGATDDEGSNDNTNGQGSTATETDVVITEGDEVPPQTLLHLAGPSLTEEGDEVVAWRWAVDQPEGSQSVFWPSEDVQSPAFEANVAGLYYFYLTTETAGGIEVDHGLVATVMVIPDELLHIELTWYTPSDEDETDVGEDMGSDVDLHFAHPNASQFDIDGDGVKDPWFDPEWDCFWYYLVQNWGSYSSSDDDPSLDRDDTDGAGPENLNLDMAEPGSYRIGVHYWDDHGYGIAYATVKVYLTSQLVYAQSEILLENHDMWDVGTLSWPSGVVFPAAGGEDGPKITHDYQHPYYYQP